MSATTLRAHYDGEHVVLDEPSELPPNTPLLVTVLAQSDPAKPAPTFEIPARLKAIYGDFVLTDEALDEILNGSRGSADEFMR